MLDHKVGPHVLKKVKIFAVNNSNDDDCEIITREPGESFAAFHDRVMDEMRLVLNSYADEEGRPDGQEA